MLYAPGARESIEEVEVTRDALLVAGYENVRGRLMRLAFGGAAWARSDVDLPANWRDWLRRLSPTASEAFAVFEDFLTPNTLYALDNQAQRRAACSPAARAVRRRALRLRTVRSHEPRTARASPISSSIAATWR